MEGARERGGGRRGTGKRKGKERRGRREEKMEHVKLRSQYCSLEVIVGVFQSLVSV